MTVTLEFCMLETVHYKMTHQRLYIKNTLLYNINY